MKNIKKEQVMDVIKVAARVTVGIGVTAIALTAIGMVPKETNKAIRACAWIGGLMLSWWIASEVEDYTEDVIDEIDDTCVRMEKMIKKLTKEIE